VGAHARARLDPMAQTSRPRQETKTISWRLSVYRLLGYIRLHSHALVLAKHLLRTQCTGHLEAGLHAKSDPQVPTPAACDPLLRLLNLSVYILLVLRPSVRPQNSLPKVRLPSQVSIVCGRRRLLKDGFRQRGCRSLHDRGPEGVGLGEAATDGSRYPASRTPALPPAHAV
jgi:hypothetical protein